MNIIYTRMRWKQHFHSSVDSIRHWTQILPNQINNPIVLQTFLFRESMTFFCCLVHTKYTKIFLNVFWMQTWFIKFYWKISVCFFVFFHLNVNISLERGKTCHIFFETSVIALSLRLYQCHTIVLAKKQGIFNTHWKLNYKNWRK